MYTYYLFIINNNAYKMYKNNPNYLYNILTTLYNLKSNNLIYGINLYNNICDTFSVKLLNNYLNERFYIRRYKDYILLKNTEEETKIKIKSSRIVIITNKRIPNIFRILNIYNKKIFIIDFKNKEYKWLNDVLNINVNI